MTKKKIFPQAIVSFDVSLLNIFRGETNSWGPADKKNEHSLFVENVLLSLDIY